MAVVAVATAGAAGSGDGGSSDTGIIGDYARVLVVMDTAVSAAGSVPIPEVVVVIHGLLVVILVATVVV